MIPLLSIIIPCYNSARFVAATVDMLLYQGLDDCELILVNDGSTDNTLEIIREYAAAHDGIRIIDQPNRGVSVARNTGLAAARGRYIYFLDSDDTLTEGSIAFFKKTLATHPDCQLFAFGYESRRDGKRVKRYSYPVYSGRKLRGEQFLGFFLDKQLCAHICSTIYERSFLTGRHLQFKEGLRIGEDILFLVSAMQAAPQVYYSDRLTFVYQLRDDSSMQYTKYTEHTSRAFVEICEMLQTSLPSALTLSGNLFLANSYLSHLWFYLKSTGSDRNIEAMFYRYHGLLYRPMSKRPRLYGAIVCCRIVPLEWLFWWKHPGSKAVA